MIDSSEVRRRLSPEELPDLLVRLGFRDDDAVETVAAAATMRRRPSEVALVAQCASLLADGVGRLRADEAPDPWEDLPADREDLALLALLASTAEVRAEHLRRGIPEEISWASLAELGQQVAVNRFTHDRFGLDTYGWMRTSWSGGLIWLGRLQFAPKPTTHGWVLDTHIPRKGPLTPQSVDDAFELAARFFPLHFPECPPTAFACTSWLLDPTLVEVLPETSNLVSFQQRWTLMGQGYQADESVLYFVFGRRADPDVEIDPDALTPTSTLQRIVLDRWRSGQHWSAWSGTAPLPAL